jgi:hypothetical protein
MEEIYLKAFHINMLKSKDELIYDFVHVINEADLAVKLAEEFIQRDSLKTFESGHLYMRMTAW